MEYEYWDKTTHIFQAIIEKPKMTEKLLKKPPFKYIFDILKETIDKTGFAKGSFI